MHPFKQMGYRRTTLQSSTITFFFSSIVLFFGFFLTLLKLNEYYIYDKCEFLVDLFLLCLSLFFLISRKDLERHSLITTHTQNQTWVFLMAGRFCHTGCASLRHSRFVSLVLCRLSFLDNVKDAGQH